MSDILIGRDPLFSSDVIENETELIPLITAEDEELMNAEQTPPELPILHLRNTVLFPVVVIPITVGRHGSIKVLNEISRGNRTLRVQCQDASVIEDLNTVVLKKLRTIAMIFNTLRKPDGSTTPVIEDKKRFQMSEIVRVDPYFTP